MIKKSVICTAALAFVFSFAVAGGVSHANNGPAEIVLKTADAKKPAAFPHKKHQEMMKCAECHHTMTADGKKGPYVAGQEKACPTCHDGKQIKDHKVATFKNAAHQRCKGCHKEGLNGKKGPTKCSACHKKGLK